MRDTFIDRCTNLLYVLSTNFFVRCCKSTLADGAGFTVVQRKFDFTRLAESALLDDFELVSRVQPVAESATSSLTSAPSHLVVAATAQRCSHTTLSATPTPPRRSVACLEPISKHVYVSRHSKIYELHEIRFCRAMLCISAACCRVVSVCSSVRLSVTFVYSVETNMSVSTSKFIIFFLFD